MTIPKIKTRGEELAERYEQNPEQTILMALLADLGASTGMNRLPEYADAGEVERNARSDFRSANYGEAMTYIDSLVKIVEHWQNWAETYHSILVGAGATFNQYGYPSLDPFAVTRDGKWIAGNADALDMDNEDHWESIADQLRQWIPICTYEPHKIAAGEALIEIESKMEKKA